MNLPLEKTRSITVVLLKNAFCGHGGAVAWVVSKFNVLKPLGKSQYWFSLEFSVSRIARQTFSATSPSVVIILGTLRQRPIPWLIPRKWHCILSFPMPKQKRNFLQRFLVTAMVLWDVNREICWCHCFTKKIGKRITIFSCGMMMSSFFLFPNQVRKTFSIQNK